MLSAAEASAWEEIVEHRRSDHRARNNVLRRMVDGLARFVGGYLAVSACDTHRVVRVMGVAEALRVLDARAAL